MDHDEIVCYGIFKSCNAVFGLCERKALVVDEMIGKEW